ncbi:extracellular solute-binding protein [Bradyrhizobium erythrophlei]|uniref:Carbohydrate ABC transporter substrate-binding protein, CUT1 family n=1 Tax=Bradyrhizobium erythrophlei TaxID=1437360 RepID=A0A1M5GXP5_9BRAD|nr:extracellular solute-binding protein [Bradyrhizobium erythrophlei]SHG08447.1 carbohydrate ABC transporter substrate-binding protein, CUT1 family [Bradyrhizobium erythrophlei]
MKLKPGSRLFAILLSGLLQSPDVAHAGDLVAPDRIGRLDAPKSFSFRVLTVHSNNNAQPKFAARMAALYEKYAHTHPDWRVNIQLMSLQIPQEHARLLEQARSGTAPDCSAVDSFEVPLFIRAGVLQPIDQYFTKEEIDDLFPFIRPIVSDAEGHIYAWWWTTDLRLLYRNMALVPDPPRTWQETKQAAMAAKRAAGPGLEGFLFNGGRNETTTVDFLPQFWAQGGKLVDERGTPVFGQEPNKTYLLNAIAFYRDLIQSGASPARVASISNYDDLTAASISGSAAMMVNGDWAMSQMRAAMKPETFAKWAVSMLPGPTADQRSTASGGWTFASFSKDPVKVKACMDLVREVYMGPATEVLERLPTRQSEFNSLPMFRTDFYLQIKQYLKLGQARPGLPIYTEISNRLQIAISEALAGTRTPEAAVDEAVDQVAKAAARYQ